MDVPGRPGAEGVDQARLPIFRALLLVEVAAAGFFGLFPLLAPDAFAGLFGYTGEPSYIYRLAGAATTGYVVMALVGFVRSRWASLRLPIVATLTFNVAAVAASLLALDDGDRSPLVLVVLAAAGLFAALSGYWLYRNEGPSGPDEPAIEPGFRLTLIVATAAAAFFGLVPLLMPRTFTDLFALSDADLYIYRLAGAATLGYAVAGGFEVVSQRWRSIAIELVGAIAFNGLAFAASAIYLAEGGRSILGPVVLVASAFFTLALTWWAARATGLGRS